MKRGIIINLVPRACSCFLYVAGARNKKLRSSWLAYRKQDEVVGMRLRIYKKERSQTDSSNFFFIAKEKKIFRKQGISNICILPSTPGFLFKFLCVFGDIFLQAEMKHLMSKKIENKQLLDRVKSLNMSPERCP